MPEQTRAMEVQVDMEIDFEQLDKDLRHLTPIQRQEVLAAETFGNFPPKTRAKHAYLTEKLDAGHNVFSVPAGVIAALSGYAYETRQNRADFKPDILQKHVDYTNHWVSKSKSSVRQSVLHQCYSDDLEFPIPGEASKSYCVRGSSE